MFSAKTYLRSRANKSNIFKQAIFYRNREHFQFRLRRCDVVLEVRFADYFEVFPIVLLRSLD